MENSDSSANNSYENELDHAIQYYEEGRLLEAKDSFLALSIKYPEEPVCHYYLGEISNRLDEFATSVEHFTLGLSKESRENVKGYYYYGLSKVYSRGGFFEDLPGSIYDQKKQLEYLNLARNAGKYPLQLIFDLERFLKGQDAIDLLEEAIKTFPKVPDIYIKLARRYSQAGLPKDQRRTFDAALTHAEEGAALFFIIGRQYLDDNKPDQAITMFRRAMESSENKGSDFAILYAIGQSYELLGNFSEAIQCYNSSMVNAKSDEDKLFGFLSLLKIYGKHKRYEECEDLLISVNLNERVLTEYASIFGSPIWLDDRNAEHIELHDLDEVYRTLGKLKISGKNDFIEGKRHALRAYLATNRGKPIEGYNSLAKARKYLATHTNQLVGELQKQIISILAYTRLDSILHAAKAVEIFDKEMSEFYEARKVVADLLQHIVESLHSHKLHDAITRIVRFFPKEVLLEKKILFISAYSYSATNQDPAARELYEYYLQAEGRDPAVLNNLGIIYQKTGDFQKAIDLYEEGLKLDPKHERLTGNLKSLKQRVAEQREHSAREKAQRERDQKAIQSLTNENDYVLEKLLRFIEQAKKDEGFENWRLPIAKYKFHSYSGVDKQRGELLREQWLKKGYIADTGLRDKYSAVIYSINPLLEVEILKLQKLKIPEKWLSGFLNISVESLQQVEYFELLDRISKVNKKFRPLLERDFNVLVQNYLFGNEKATVVLSGSLVELALTFYCERKRIIVLPITDSKGNTKNKRLYDCVLSDLIDYTEQTRPFGTDFVHLSNLSRIYRNFIHPGRELKDSLDKAKADLCFVSTCEILRRVV